MSLANVWDKIKIFCLNHEEPEPMVIMGNTEIIKTPFYVCATTVSGENSEARFVSGRNCANRLNLDDYKGLVFKFLEILSSDILGTDFTNYSFYYKGTRQKIFVKVLHYSNSRIDLGIKNVSVLGCKK